MSRALEDKVTAVGVDRSGIAEIAKLTAGAEQPMRGITNWRDAASKPWRGLGETRHRPAWRLITQRYVVLEAV